MDRWFTAETGFFEASRFSNCRLQLKAHKTIGNWQSKIDNGSMIVGTGIDIAEVPRIAESIARFGDRFLNRVFTAGEIKYCDSKANRVERYAARFAAKEAAMKALGTGWNHGVRWRDIEVQRKPGGRPTLALHGKAAEFASRLGTKNVALSLTHTADQAFAQVILE